MSSVLEYKCPCCGGAIAFDSASQKMKCPFCDTEFEMQTLKDYDEQLKSEAPDRMNWDERDRESWNPEGMVSYICHSCGGEIVGDATMAATSCPFCSNPVVIKEQVQGTYKPDIVIPFQLDREAAKKALQGHMKGKRLLPKSFVREMRIEEIKGIYLPFWLFDASCDAALRFRATRTHHWSDRKYNYTETQYYSLYRAGEAGFVGVPVDGSSAAPDDLMESIEPFDLSRAVDFQTAYLAGYFADRYDVDDKASIGRANERIKTSVEELFRGTITGYQTVRSEASSVNLSQTSTRLAFFPVWMLTTKWKDKNYTFAMNGQTGKFIGDLPVDRTAAWLWRAGIFAVSAAAFYGLVALIHLLF